MKRINKAQRTTFAVALVWSVLAVVGIPMIVFGAIWLSPSPGLGIPLLSIGILFLGSGFYGIPLFWVSYGEKRVMYRIVYAVSELGLTSVSALASYMNMKTDSVHHYIDTCFKRGYLVNYMREGDRITPITYTPPADIIHDAECGSCGAKFQYKGEMGECPYCHSPHKSN